MGGVNKPLLKNSTGTSLLSEGLSALHSVFGDELSQTVVVGPESLDSEVRQFSNAIRVQEHPPFSGPASAVAAGAQAISEATAITADSRWTEPSVVVLLAADVVKPQAALAFLRNEIRRTPDLLMVVPKDANGHPQWLMSAVSWAHLLKRVQSEPPEEILGQSLRWLLDANEATFIDMPAEVSASTQDVDTPADAAQHGITLS